MALGGRIEQAPYEPLPGPVTGAAKAREFQRGYIVTFDESEPRLHADRHQEGFERVPGCVLQRTDAPPSRNHSSKWFIQSAASSENPHMSYATLMVHMELGRPNTGLLSVTAELAGRFHAGVVGIAARQPMQMIYGDGYVSGDIYQQDRDEIIKELNAAEEELRAALHGRVAFVEWRSSQTYAYLADYFANETRCADLILTGVGTGDFLDASRAVNTGELIMLTGRPVLLVPTAATTLKLGHVLVGWKDTRETRRAVSDALPLLKLAARVSVIEIAAQEDLAAAERHVQDVSLLISI